MVLRALVLAAVIVADMTTTRVGLALGAQELNPLIAWSLESIGWLATTVLRLMVAPAYLGLMVFAKAMRPTRLEALGVTMLSDGCLLFACAAGMYVVVGNLTVIEMLR